MALSLSVVGTFNLTVSTLKIDIILSNPFDQAVFLDSVNYLVKDRNILEIAKSKITELMQTDRVLAEKSIKAIAEPELSAYFENI